MEQIRKCLICGKKYKTIRENAKYCSNECRYEGLKMRQAERKKVEKENKKKLKNKPDNITEIAVAAKNAGMSYGKYVASMGL